ADRAADGRAVAAEPPLPERVADDDGAVRADDVLPVRERAPERRRGAERGEEAARHVRRREVLRLRAVAVHDADVVAVERADRREAAQLALPVLQLDGAHRAALLRDP